MHAKREPAAEPAAHVVEPGSARYFAWLYAGEHRELVRTLLTIEHEIESSLRPGLEHQVAHVRLAWWREECERFAHNTPVHPATRRLLELAGSGVAGFELQGLVEATAWDLAAAPPETRDEIERHCERWADAMIVPLARDAAMTASARALGAALRETELLLRLAPDARRGWLRLPVDELDALGIGTRSLAAPPWPQSLAVHVRQRFETLRASLRGSLATIDRPALHAWSAVAGACAARAIRSLPEVHRGHRLEGMANALYAWRAARGALRSGGVRSP